MNGIELVDKIDTYCKKNKITRKEFCERIKIKQTTISNWKSSNCLPPIETIYKICIELNCSFNWLLTGDEFFNIKLKENNLSEFLLKYQNELLKLEHLSPADFNLVINLINRLSKIN